MERTCVCDWTPAGFRLSRGVMGRFRLDLCVLMTTVPSSKGDAGVF